MLNQQGAETQFRSRWFQRAYPRPLVLVATLALSLVSKSQEADTTRSHPGRPLLVGVGLGVGITASMLVLNETWYSQYDRAPFHTFNDGDEWLQMDKCGHAFSAYTLGRWGHSMLAWAGAKERTAVWLGGSLGLVYNTGLEILDGTSAEWGFSWWDMAANVAGTSLFIGQQLGWHEQRITLKLSSHLTDHAAQNPDLLGSSTPERLLKDYNGQTYWLSFNLRSFSTLGKWPAWLNVAAGYGADGMISANPVADHEAAPSDYPAPYRQFYLAPDVRFTSIHSRSSFVRTLLFALDCIKIPAPTLEFQSNGKVVGHLLYF